MSAGCQRRLLGKHGVGFRCEKGCSVEHDVRNGWYKPGAGLDFGTTSTPLQRRQIVAQESVKVVKRATAGKCRRAPLRIQQRCSRRALGDWVRGLSNVLKASQKVGYLVRRNSLDRCGHTLYALCQRTKHWRRIFLYSTSTFYGTCRWWLHWKSSWTQFPGLLQSP